MSEADPIGWRATLQPTHGGAVLVLPAEVLALAGVQVGDDMDISVSPSGTFVLVRRRKVAVRNEDPLRSVPR